MQTLPLPGLDCGLCGYRTCDAFDKALFEHPDFRDRCVHLHPQQAFPSPHETSRAEAPRGSWPLAEAPRWHDTGSGVCASLNASNPLGEPTGCASMGATSGCGCASGAGATCAVRATPLPWRDTLGREFDFYLEHFPEDAGPREVIMPRNPMIVRELEIRPGDILLGRPLGMSCGCPITHCGIATQVDSRCGVVTWCVTGPLESRQGGFKDLGYYSAEAYEGRVRDTRVDLKIGMRYFFQPRMCMLQWRHSGLVNYVSRTTEGWQVRLEGLWIG